MKLRLRFRSCFLCPSLKRNTSSALISGSLANIGGRVTSPTGPKTRLYSKLLTRTERRVLERREFAPVTGPDYRLNTAFLRDRMRKTAGSRASYEIDRPI